MTEPKRASGGRPASGLGREYAFYLGLRLALFLVALIVLLVVGLNSLLAAVVAVVISGVLSYPLAKRQRERVVEAYRVREQRKQPPA